LKVQIVELPILDALTGWLTTNVAHQHVKPKFGGPIGQFCSDSLEQSAAGEGVPPEVLAVASVPSVQPGIWQRVSGSGALRGGRR
jgi:hypothetical protein